MLASSTAFASSRCRWRCATRAAGRSSITVPRSLYYMIKVMLAVFVSLFRRYPALEEEQ